MLDYDKFNNNASLDLVINFAARKKILRSQRFYSIYIYAASLLDDRRRKKERKKKRNWKELADKSEERERGGGGEGYGHDGRGARPSKKGGTINEFRGPGGFYRARYPRSVL